MKPDVQGTLVHLACTCRSYVELFDMTRSCDTVCCTEAKQRSSTLRCRRKYMMYSARRALGVTCQARPTVGYNAQLDGALSDFIVFGRTSYRQRSTVSHCQQSPERGSQGPSERVRSTLHAGLQMHAVTDQQLIIDRLVAHRRHVSLAVTAGTKEPARTAHKLLMG